MRATPLVVMPTTLARLKVCMEAHQQQHSMVKTMLMMLAPTRGLSTRLMRGEALQTTPTWSLHGGMAQPVSTD